MEYWLSGAAAAPIGVEDIVAATYIGGTEAWERAGPRQDPRAGIGVCRAVGWLMGGERECAHYRISKSCCHCGLAMATRGASAQRSREGDGDGDGDGGGCGEGACACCVRPLSSRLPPPPHPTSIAGQSRGREGLPCAPA